MPPRAKGYFGGRERVHPAGTLDQPRVFSLAPHIFLSIRHWHERAGRIGLGLIVAKHFQHVSQGEYGEARLYLRRTLDWI